MSPNDIPTAITKLVYTLPFDTSKVYSQNQAADLLAHFWPAIAEHFAQLLLDENPDRDADFSAGVDWAIATIREQTKGSR